MNDMKNVEDLLRKAPRPKVPSGLRERLEADVTLPRTATNAFNNNDWRPALKRWLPAFAFSVFFLGCVVAIAVQANLLVELRRENWQLQISANELEQSHQQQAESQKLADQTLEQLRKDNAELKRLQDEITQLQQEVRELADLRAQNQQLTASLKSAQAQAAAGGPPEEDPFKAQKDEAQSIQCVSNLKQVGLAARMWANDHGDVLPQDFVTMKNELNTPKILVCPADGSRTRARIWEEFSPANVSYELLAPGVSETEPPQTVLTRCPNHGHVGLIDGSVQRGMWKRAVQRNGRWVLE
ncbi:MAG: hypothetical protein L0Y58_09810 [Verrucomicrobia subdivision 3 bacterium]|nr:hypothetical protein [Limisphaerales bacterium]